jgi:hypothetical protein
VGKGKKAAKAADNADRATAKGKSAGGDSTCAEAGGQKKATDLKVIRKGTKEWDEAVKDMKAPGKSKNYRVQTEEDAKDLLKEARGDIQQKPTYVDGKYKKGFEVHPNEAGTRLAPHNDLPHIKWKDWEAGKSSGANGHVFFGE